MKRRIITAAVLITMAFCCVTPCYAEDEDNVVVIESSQEDTNELQTQRTSNKEEAQEIKEEIKNLSRKENYQLSESDVKAIRKKYTQLPDAYKVLVGSITPLEEAEKKLNITYADDELLKDENGVDPDNKTGTTYTFEITEESTSATISILYVEDSSSDNLEFTITSPDGKSNIINSDTMAVQNSSIVIEVTRNSGLCQLDISKATAGIWNISSGDVECTFKKSEYIPEAQEVTEGNISSKSESQESSSSSEDQTADTETIIQEEEETGNNGGFVKLVLMVIILIGAIVALLMLKLRPWDKKEKNPGKDYVVRDNSNKDKQKTKENKKAPQMTEAEEKAELKRYLEELEKDDTDESENYPVEEDRKSYPEEDTLEENADQESNEEEYYEEYPSTILAQRKKDEEADQDEEDEFFGF